MKSLINKHIGKIINANCLDILKDIPDNSIDCVITDPPFGINYQSNRRKIKHEKIVNDDALFLFLNELIRITKEDGCLFIFYSWKNKLIDDRIKNEIIWVKDNWSAGDLKGNYGNMYETIAFIPRLGFKMQKRYPNVFECKRANCELHPTEKPVGIINFLLRSATKKDDLILDPFCGSGTTCVAAKQNHRRYIGIDISDKYCEIARRRLKETTKKMFI